MTNGADLDPRQLQQAVLDLMKKQEGLHEQVKQLQEKLDACQSVLSTLREERLRLTDGGGEREAYLKALTAMSREEITFQEEEIREMEKNGLTLDQVIRRLEHL